MTDKSKVRPTETAKPSMAFHLEADRCPKGMSVLLSGIIGISDFSDAVIELRSHGGRITVKGQRLNISVFDGGSVEIIGRVEEVAFKYGKN